MDQDLKNKIDHANAGHADPEQAFERFLDGLIQLPAGLPVSPACSWCNWRRGDSPRNLNLCGFHTTIRNRMRNTLTGR
jgi:hypothetical protein